MVEKENLLKKNRDSKIVYFYFLLLTNANNLHDIKPLYY